MYSLKYMEHDGIKLYKILIIDTQIVSWKDDTIPTLVWTSVGEVYGHIESVKILVILNPTGYMLTSSNFDAFIHSRYILL